MGELVTLLPEILQALRETAIMLAIGLGAALLLGGPLGILLYLWQRPQLLNQRRLYLVVSALVNLVRSFPFVILVVSLVPITRLLTGSSIGPVAAAVPLAAAAIPYFARLVEQSLTDIPRGVIEASKAMGANTWQLVWHVLLVEAKPSLILAFTTLTISFISYTAVAGIVGGGGIGDLAIRYGYYRFRTDIMVAMVVLLVILVQSIQYIGNRLSRMQDHR